MRKIILALGLLLALMYAPPAMALHPHEDDEIRARNGIPRDPSNPLPTCEEGDEEGVYISFDNEIWVCWTEDPGIPGIPPIPQWVPVPKGPQNPGGETAFSRRWDPVSIPGWAGVYSRFLPRTEWLNPTDAGSCPNVVGGCKLKGGADIQLYRNGAPFTLHKSWFNHALQMYVYNSTTAVWEKKTDTGWMMGSASVPTYISEMVGTYDYGTAPYGAKYYFFRGQERFWNGSAWAPPIVADPKNASGGLGYVWDPPPGYTGKKPKAPKEAPKLEKVKKKSGFIEPTPIEPVAPADNTPTTEATP